MSYQRQILEIELIGNTRGFEAAEQRLNAGMNRVGSGARRMSNDLGLVDKQLMAIGTTARYALAGSLVFGLTGAIQRLTDFQNQLGTVAALVGQVGQGGQYRPASQGFLGSIGDQAMLTANQVGIATDDVQQYMSRFFSAFSYQNPQSRRAISDMRQFVGEVSRLQAAMGAEAGDPQALAGGIAGFINQIPGGRRNVGRNANRVANMIYYLTAQTPNITGADISRDIGRIGASGLAQAGFTPEQVFAIWTQAGMAGGSSSVIGRGISQMMGNLLHPVTPTQQQAYLSAGLPIDPNALRQMGAMTVLRRMMRSATTGPVRARNRFALNDENIDDPTAAINAAGVSGINLSRVYGFFERQESARQFVNLLAQGGVPALGRFVKSIQDAEKANTARSREDAAIRQRTLARFNTARQNISLGLARGIEWPLENIVAPPIIHASNLLAGSRTARIGVDAAFGALLARSALRRFRATRGIGGAAAAGVIAEEAPNLVRGGFSGAPPTGTRADPMWVMISPASWLLGSPGGFSSPTTDKPTSFLAKATRKIPRVLPLGMSPETAIATGVFAGTAAEAWWLSHGHRPQPHILNRLGDMSADRRLAIARADQYASQTLGFNAQRVLSVEGNAKADLTIKLVDAQGRTIVVQEQKGVPVKNWRLNSLPTSQGKTGLRKGK